MVLGNIGLYYSVYFTLDSDLFSRSFVLGKFGIYFRNDGGLEPSSPKHHILLSCADLDKSDDAGGGTMLGGIFAVLDMGGDFGTALLDFSVPETV